MTKKELDQSRLVAHTQFMTNTNTLSDLDARYIAGSWHGGMSSPLYALTSTGAIPNLGALQDEIHECLLSAGESSPGGKASLYALSRYAADAGERGPQVGWVGPEADQSLIEV